MNSSKPKDWCQEKDIWEWLSFLFTSDLKDKAIVPSERNTSWGKYVNKLGSLVPYVWDTAVSRYGTDISGLAALVFILS